MAIDNVHIVPQGSGLWTRPRWVKQGLWALSVESICGKYINIFTRCTIRNQHDILKTAVADVSKGQTDMSYTGELQTLTKLSMRHGGRVEHFYETSMY